MTRLRNMKVGWKEGSISSGRSLYQCGFSKPYRSDTHRHPVNPCLSNLNPVMTHVHTQTWWAIKYLPFFVVTWTSRSPDIYYVRQHSVTLNWAIPLPPMGCDYFCSLNKDDLTNITSNCKVCKPDMKMF